MASGPDLLHHKLQYGEKDYDPKQELLNYLFLNREWLREL
jgi:hypothetical protein